MIQPPPELHALKLRVTVVDMSRSAFGLFRGGIYFDPSLSLFEFTCMRQLFALPNGCTLFKALFLLTAIAMVITKNGSIQT
jgi:hypothetical protein